MFAWKFPPNDVVAFVRPKEACHSEDARRFLVKTDDSATVIGRLDTSHDNPFPRVDDIVDLLSDRIAYRDDGNA
jgi:hypothetical protein